MKNKFSKFLTLLLAIVMIFGVCAPTVAYAYVLPDRTVIPDDQLPNGTLPEAPDPTDSLDVGWCEVSYDENGLTVTLRPDFDALLDISEAQIKDLIHEVKKVVSV